jgi:hypothetical protein
MYSQRDGASHFLVDFNRGFEVTWEVDKNKVGYELLYVLTTVTTL